MSPSRLKPEKKKVIYFMPLPGNLRTTILETKNQQN